MESDEKMVLMNKKADLSLQVVVIAVLCLLVLIVLSIIFTSKMMGWNEGLRHCDTVCMSSAKECTDAGYGLPLYWSNCEDTQGNEFKKHAYCCKEKND